MEKTIILNDDLISNYQHIGTGGEGDIYKYDGNVAIKRFYKYNDKKRKYQMIRDLCELKDKSFCFPLGLVKNEQDEYLGYYMPLVDTKEDMETFAYLLVLRDQRKKLEYFIKADEAMQRIHKLGIAIGDIRENNILIDKNDNPVFIDTDNYSYFDSKYNFDDIRLHWLEMIYHKKFSKMDIDKYLYALMIMDTFSYYANLYEMQSDEFFEDYISLLNVDNETKEGLRLIFSDSHDKPYIGPILKRIKPDREIITMDAIDKCLGIK